MKMRAVFICIVAIFLLVCLCGVAIFLYNKLAYPLKFEREILNASKQFNVDKKIIASIINAESHFNCNAISSKGAIGLMQIMPETAEYVVKKILNEKNFDVKELRESGFDIELLNKKVSKENLLEPQANIKIGTYYFSYLMSKFNNFDVAICAYNAGEGNVKKWLLDSRYSDDGKTLKKIPYQETRNYLNKIKLNLKVYENKF